MRYSLLSSSLLPIKTASTPPSRKRPPLLRHLRLLQFRPRRSQTPRSHRTMTHPGNSNAAAAAAGGAADASPPGPRKTAAPPPPRPGSRRAPPPAAPRPRRRRPALPWRPSSRRRTGPTRLFEFFLRGNKTSVREQERQGTRARSQKVSLYFSLSLLLFPLLFLSLSRFFFFRSLFCFSRNQGR